MSCPDEIADILLEILKDGILRIRALGWSENPSRCAIEADHLHNLPELVAHFSPDLLRFYWEVSRPSFMKESTPAELVEFSPLWDRLSAHVQRANVLV
jgi:hypothetical protein